MTHTPGHWAVSSDPLHYDTLTHVANSRGHLLASMHGSDVSEMEANACLMAAAPDLLEALKAILAHQPDHGDTIWQQVEDAIAKAEGRT